MPRECNSVGSISGCSLNRNDVRICPSTIFAVCGVYMLIENLEFSPSKDKTSAFGLIDRVAVLERMGGDESLLVEVVRIIQEYAPQRRAEIRDAATIGDYARLAMAVHAFKGMIGYLDAGPATAAILRLEQGANSADPRETAAALADFEIQLTDLLNAATELMIMPNSEIFPAPG
jgi:hypothetical protein